MFQVHHKYVKATNLFQSDFLLLVTVLIVDFIKGIGICVYIMRFQVDHIYILKGYETSRDEPSWKVLLRPQAPCTYSSTSIRTMARLHHVHPSIRRSVTTTFI